MKKIKILLLGVMLFGFSASALAQVVVVDNAKYCPKLFQTLVRGSRGSQVVELQKFLSSYYGVPATTIQTGYFGPITQSYVIQFQKSTGLPAFGIVGPMTRGAISKVCSSSNDSGINFVANPTYGALPLVVSFSARSEINYSAEQYYINFGDGTPDANMQGIFGVCAVGAGGPCNGGNNMISSHVYANPGTYTATLNKRYVCNSYPGTVCPALYSTEVGRVTITVVP